MASKWLVTGVVCHLWDRLLRGFGNHGYHLLSGILQVDGATKPAMDIGYQLMGKPCFNLWETMG